MIAIDALLLRKSDRRGIILDSLHGLLHRSSREGPAGATVTLVFDWGDFAFSHPIYGLASLKVTTFIIVTRAVDAIVVVRLKVATSFIVTRTVNAIGVRLLQTAFHWLHKSQPLFELVVCQVACFVQAKGHSSAFV